MRWYWVLFFCFIIMWANEMRVRDLYARLLDSEDKINKLKDEIAGIKQLFRKY